MPIPITIRGQRGLFTPEEELQQPDDFMSQPTPWDRPDYATQTFDKYGKLGGGAQEELARQLAEKSDDYAQADAQAAAMRKNPRAFDTENYIQEQIYTPLNKRWNPQVEEKVVAAAPAVKPEKMTTFERNTALWQKQLEAAAAAIEPEEKTMLQEQADITQSWLKKQGMFKPDKSPTKSESEAVNQVLNPAYKDNTNAPPLISLTNRTTKVSGPVASSRELKPGDVLKGYKYLGGDKSDRKNWKKVQP